MELSKMNVIINLLFRADPEFEIYHISYLWYTFVGAAITIIIAVIVSFLFGANKPKDMNPKLLAPFVRRMIWGKDVMNSDDAKKKCAPVKGSKANKSLEDPNGLELS